MISLRVIPLLIQKLKISAARSPRAALFRVAILLCIIYAASDAIYWRTKRVYTAIGFPIPRYTYKTDQVLHTSQHNERLVIERHYNNRTTLWDRKSVIEVNSRIADVPRTSNRVAIVTGMKKLSGTLSSKFMAYPDFASAALQNILMYSHLYDYPLYFLTGHLMDSIESDFLWAKLPLLERYLKLGYEWVMWIDVDVLFMNFDLRLETFLEDVGETSHFVGVLECGRFEDESFRTNVRAGFFFVRNSPQGYEFLRHWRSLKQVFASNPLFDQAALSDMASKSEWRRMMLIHPTWVFHTYSECYQDDSFSVHFPNTERKWYLRQWAARAPTIPTDVKVELRYN